MPVCVNCGGGDFLWLDTLRTGGFGNKTLSLRSKGALPLGTRICRGCGHADLFLKDPSVLKDITIGKDPEFRSVPGALGDLPAAPAMAPPVATTPPAVAWSEEAEPTAALAKKPARRKLPPKAKQGGPPLILD